MKKERKKGGAAVAMISVLCFVLVLVCTLLLVLAISARHCVTNRAVPAAMSETSFAQLQIDGRTAAEIVLEDFVADDRVTLEDVEQLMEEGTFSEYAANLLSRYNTYLMEGGEFPELSANDFVLLIEQNEDLILERTGLEFLEPDKEKLRANLSASLDSYNTSLRQSVGSGIGGFGARAMVSVWLEVVLGVILLALLIWMIVLYVRRSCRVGTALKTYGVAAFIPCILLVICGLAGVPVLKTMEAVFAAGLAAPAAGAMTISAAVGAFAAVMIFAVGLLCNRLTKKPVPAEAEALEETSAEVAEEVPAEPSADEIPAAEPAAAEEPEEPAQRRFCRNCGKPLVNPDAKFCYKCGNIQEHVKPAEKDTETP